MSADELLVEAGTRCVMIMRRYREAGRTPRSKEKMIAEVEMISGWLTEIGLYTTLAQAFINSLVMCQLIERCGFTAGRRLSNEFARTFAIGRHYELSEILSFSKLLQTDEILN